MIEYANHPLARDGLMQYSELCPPCASNRNQACREGFLGDWPGREPIICKRWGLGLSQELPESLLPVRASLGAAKSACNNRGFSPSPAFFVVETALRWKPGTAKQNVWWMPYSPATSGVQIVVIVTTIASVVTEVKGTWRGDVFVLFG